jgi:hypothetical protein
MLIVEQVINHYIYTRLYSVVRGRPRTLGNFDCTLQPTFHPKPFLSLIWAIHDVRFAPNVIHAKGLSSGLLQLSLVDGKNIVLQRHDLRGGRTISSTAGVIEGVSTHDVLVISKLEVILNDEILVSGEEKLAQNVVNLSRTAAATDFLMSYLSSFPFFTFSKSHAMTYCPVEVMIAFSTCPSPWLNLRI